MRTTIRLEPALVRAVKRVAAASGRTFTDVVKDALLETVARAQLPRRRRRIQLPVFRGGGGLRPGVTLDHGVELRNLMDGLRAPP